MTGTKDILAIFSSGDKLSLSAEDLDTANLWIDENKDRLSLVHFGETAVHYRNGEISAQYLSTRQQVLEQI